MTAPPADELQALLAFNHQVLQQALGLVRVCQATPGVRYAGPVGAHLRHVIEHHEALLTAASSGDIHYDGRSRDRQLEADPALAASRLSRLIALLEALHQQAGVGARQDRALRVRGQCGLDGSACFTVGSSLGRELAFVAGHAIHHFALLMPHARQQGLPLPAGFGIAPSTVAHQRFTALGASSTAQQETPCQLTPLTA